MVFRFRTHQVRAQVEHALGVSRQQPHNGTGHAPEPSLFLSRTGSLVFLTSTPQNGGTRAYAIGFGAVEPIQSAPHSAGDSEAIQSPARGAARAALDADDDIGPHDFAEPIAVAAFEKALTRAEVAIVVRRTYINVLGGQPMRASITPSNTCPMHRRGTS